MLTCFLLVGMVASTCGGIRGCSSVDCVVRRFLADASAWVPVYLVSWALAFGAFCLCQVQAVAAYAAPPVLFILRLPGFLGDCGFADVGGGFGSGN